MTRTRELMGRLPLLPDQRPLAYVVGLIVSGIAWWIRWGLDAAFPPGFPYLTFFPAVVVISFLFGRGPGIMTAVLCGILAWYFFIPPANSFVLSGQTFVALGFYVAVVAVDIGLIDAMQRANQRSAELAAGQQRLAERTELLFSELQHRVSNNLQMVGAMLSLQQRQIVDPLARLALADASTKLQLIGRIQRQLYSTSGEQVPLDIFLRDLASDLVAADGKPGVRHRIDAEAGILLPPDAAIPLALIMAEGIANAIEHGFADRTIGLVTISLARRDGGIALRVADDGAGLPPGFDIARSNSLGLKVMRSLAVQMGADLALLPRDPTGTVMQLLLPQA